MKASHTTTRATQARVRVLCSGLLEEVTGRVGERQASNRDLTPARTQRAGCAQPRSDHKGSVQASDGGLALDALGAIARTGRTFAVLDEDLEGIEDVLDGVAIEGDFARALGEIEFVLQHAGQELHLRQVTADKLGNAGFWLGFHGIC